MGRRRLLLGRAGSGKTHLVTRALEAHLRAGRERRALLLVPTLSQASHLKRLLLTRSEGLAGFFDESVVTFTSLAERVLPEQPIGELLSGTGRDLVLRRAVLRDPPAAFRRIGLYPGFRRAALEFLKELKQNGLAPEELDGHLERLAEASGGATRERLTAFRSVFGAYEAELRSLSLVDHEDYLRMARDVLAAGGAGWIDPRLLAVDGFQNFTRLERDLLLLVADRARETVATLPWGPGADRADVGPFGVAHETRTFLERHGFVPEALEGNRRARSPGIARLEAGLAGAGGGAAPSDGSVRVLEGADPADEADRVARTVVRLVREEGRRYREFVVVVRDVAVRRDLLRASFARHRVPLRIYGADEVARLPYARSVLNLLRVAAGDLGRDRVLALLRSGHVAEVAPGLGDRIEDDLFSRPEPADAREWDERLRGWSDEAADLLSELVAFGAAQEGRRPAELADAALELVERRLTPLWLRDLADRDRVRAEARAREVVRTALEEVGRALDREASGAGLAEVVALLSEVLRDTRAAVPDRRLDVVNMIDAREARQWEAPVVFVCGLVEGEFPRSPREDVFLDDDDRRRENRAGGLALRERELLREEERYLFYVALTRARDRLYLTVPVTDGRGEETLRSLLLRDALEGLDGVEVSRRRLSRVLPLEEETADRADLRRRALLGLGEPFRRGTAEETRARRAAALHDALVSAPDRPYVRAVQVAERFLPPLRASIRDPSPLAARHPPERGWSASALEDFAQCPFLHFARRTLGLRESPRAAAEGLAPPVLGEIAHEVLRVAFLSALDGEPLPGAEHLERIFDEVLAEKAGGLAGGLREQRAARELLASLVSVVEGERERLGRIAYRPTILEETFSARFEDPELVLRGKVDRIDVDPSDGAVLIDYKYSKRGFDAGRREEAEAGVHFQLPVYLLAVERVFGLRPMGAWFLKLRDPETSGYAIADGPRPDRPVELDREGLAALLARTRTLATELAERVLAGEIDVAPRDEGRCARCGYRDLCRLPGAGGDA